MKRKNLNKNTDIKNSKDNGEVKPDKTAEHKKIKSKLKNVQESSETTKSKLEKSNKKLQLIIDSMPAVIGYINTEYKFQFVNKFSEVFLNANPSNIIGKHIKDVVGAKAFAQVKPKYDEAFKGVRQEFEALIPMPNADLRPVQAIFVPHKDKGKVLGAFILIQDISKRQQVRKELEEAKKELEKANIELSEALKLGVNQFNLFADNYKGNVFIKDDKLEYIFLNQTSLKTFKLNKKEIKGLTDHDLYPKNIANKLHEVDLEIQNKKQIIDKEFKISGNNINEKWERVIKFPIQMPDGKTFVGGIAFDISLEKQRSQVIINSELRYRSLFESARDSIFIIDYNKIIDVNQSTLIKFRYKDKSEILNKSIFDIFPEFQPDGSRSKDSSEKYIKKVMAGESQLFNWKHKRKDGTEFHSQVSLNQFSYNKNKFILASVRDISKKVALEKDLIKAKENAEISEKYLNNIINNIGDPVFVNDEQNIFLLVNDAFCQFLGLTREYIIGKTLTDDFTEEEMEGFFRDNKEVLETGQESIIEEFVTLKGGETKTIYTKKTRYIDANGKKHLIGVVRDITDRKLAEENIKETLMQLNLAVETAKIGVWTHNIATDKLVWNSELFKIFGITPSEFDGSAEAFTKMVHPEDLEIVMEHFNNAFQSKSVAGFNYRIIRPNNEVRYIYASVTPIFDNEKNLTKITGINLDVTGDKIAEETLKESKAKFEILSDVTFEGILIHDKGVPIDVNNSFPKMFGYTKDEFINEDLIKLIIKKDYQNSVLENIKNEYQLPYEVIGIKKDGTEFPIEIEGKTYISKENKKFRVTAIRDITDRKIAEEKLEQANLELIEAVSSLNELKKQLEDQNVYLKNELDLVFNFEEMVYGSNVFSKVLTDLERVAPTDATVLILGESGTGKELLARALHNLSLRKDKPFIKVNCSAIPSELIESEFFGHKKGSFTGAVSDKVGKFELAEGGTLFLDEIGDLPLAMQPKILRFLQEGEMEVVGGTVTRSLDVRIVAATNKDLKEEVNNAQFREDLYFRLNVFPIEAPALRDRKEDIPLLVEHFVEKFGKKYRKNITYIADTAMQDMRVYNWPGNIRELENLVERSVILSDSETLILPGFGSEKSKRNRPISSSKLTLNDVQRNHILSVLEKANWKIDGPDGAALILDIKPSTLRDKMKKLGITRPN